MAVPLTESVFTVALLRSVIRVKIKHLDSSYVHADEPGHDKNDEIEAQVKILAELLILTDPTEPREPVELINEFYYGTL